MPGSAEGFGVAAVAGAAASIAGGGAIAEEGVDEVAGDFFVTPTVVGAVVAVAPLVA